MSASLEDRERAACTPIPVARDAFNPAASLPYGVTAQHIYSVMADFTQFLGFINQALNAKGLVRLESMLMQANFSSIVGEFVKANLPTYCSTITVNRHHNGHPDLLPMGMYSHNDVEHGAEGIEVKASRRNGGWQGHNPEDCWLMVFVYDSNKPTEADRGQPKPFRFLTVVGARLVKADWSFSGRGEGSRRTITASVIKSGFAKLSGNWIYRAPDVSAEAAAETTQAALEPVETDTSDTEQGQSIYSNVRDNCSTPTDVFVSKSANSVRVVTSMASAASRGIAVWLIAK